eukprot:CAMPEP_0202693360 /NCGR_PEP_ID=MMETSP1385-20130828/7503_1 /ASSEMBLY_ACC=CAM_ASM_000861 /TAXON_ID=933848 /ORGANISM="Elphidium margaritaceum" /LENGTH=191 /DNA_ID=CAMNT_0049349031 /DNA_START=738 /DNA_END=1313 /DNA_ORIENTATION=-
MAETQEKKISAQKSQTLFDMIGDEDGYEALMDHLQAEFCVENLLFLTELIQFRDHLTGCGMMQRYSLRDISATKELNVPISIPKSPLLQQTQLNTRDDDDDTQTFFDFFVAIYEKYICDRSNLQINISYTKRQALAHEYNSQLQRQRQQSSNVSVETIWDALVLSAGEIISLLHHSAGRCKLVAKSNKIAK